jgi:group I intron endonuclease
MPVPKSRDGLPTCSKSGVYVITNENNGKVYVGSTIYSLRRRMGRHRAMLRGNRHFNRHLQQAWNKDGEGAFHFGILEVCEPNECQKRETWWIREKRAVEARYGYNFCPSGGGSKGFKHSEESKTLMKITNKGKRLGKKHTLESRAKMSRAKKGKPGSRTGAVLPQETKDKIRLGNTGKKHTDEARAKMSAARKGKPMSDKHKAAMKVCHWSKGPNAAAIAAKIAKGLTGKKFSQERKDNISVAKTKKTTSTIFEL